VTATIRVARQHDAVRAFFDALAAAISMRSSRYDG
jgi:hypothetical protein